MKQLNSEFSSHHFCCAGAQVDAESSERATPLLIAAMRGYSDIAKV